MKSKVDDVGLELFRKVKSGDLSAIKAFIEKYQDRVFSYCYVIIGDRFEAEHLAMITFEKVISNVHNIREEKKFLSYMLTIARNLCLDKVEGDKIEESVSPIPDENCEQKTLDDYTKQTIDDSYDSQLDILIGQETLEQTRTLVDRKMQELPSAQWEAIYLVHYMGFTYKEAAGIARCSEGAMKTRVNRGMKRLTRSLIRNKVDKLPDDQKEAVRLVYFEGLSIGEAARQLRCSEQAMKSRIGDALKPLCRLVKKEIEGLRVPK